MSENLAVIFVSEARSLMVAGINDQALRSLDNALACRGLRPRLVEEIVAIKVRLIQQSPYEAEGYCRQNRVMLDQERSLIKLAQFRRPA